MRYSCCPILEFTFTIFFAGSERRVFVLGECIVSMFGSL